MDKWRRAHCSGQNISKKNASLSGAFANNTFLAQLLFQMTTNACIATEGLNCMDRSFHPTAICANMQDTWARKTVAVHGLQPMQQLHVFSDLEPSHPPTAATLEANCTCSWCKK